VFFAFISLFLYLDLDVKALNAFILDATTLCVAGLAALTAGALAWGLAALGTEVYAPACLAMSAL
jgi:hypothetical protein